MQRRLGVLFLSVLVLGMISQAALAEDKKFSVQSLTVSSGEDAVAGGLTGILQLTNKRNDLLEFAVQQEIAWLIGGRKLKIGKSTDLVIAGSLGHHQGSFWVGPFVSVSRPLAKKVSVSSFYWPGWYPTREPRNWKNDNKPNREGMFVGHLASATVDVGPIGLTYSWQDFLNEPPNELPGISYSLAVRKDLGLRGSATWNNNAQSWMWYLGATWRPQRE